MGFDHTGSGLLVGLATVPIAPVHQPAEQVAWVIGVGGTALLADLDTVSSSAARMWGPLSGAMARGIGAIAGGHREGTHDAVLAPLAVLLLTQATRLSSVLAGAELALFLGLAVQGLGLSGFGRVGPLVNLALSAGGAWWLCHHHPVSWQLLAWAGALGVWTHIAGDCLTTELVPVPVVWMFGRRWRVGVPLFQVGHAVERFVVAPLLTVATGWLLCRRLGIQSMAELSVWVGSHLHALARLLAAGGRS